MYTERIFLLKENDKMKQKEVSYLSPKNMMRKRYGIYFYDAYYSAVFSCVWFFVVVVV